MSPPLVTIGLPVYNSERTVEDTIRSILAQTYQHWKLIIVNDGSTDRSIELCTRIDDPRIEIHDSLDNRGLAYRLNQISRLASGDLIARMDADDLMHPERLERQVWFLRDHPEIDIVGTGMISIDNDFKVHRRWRAEPESSDECMRSAAMAHPSIMGRTRWFRNNPYDESFLRAEDMELWTRTRKSRRSTNLPEDLLFYREVGVFSYAKHVKSARYERRVFHQHCRASATMRELIAYELRSRVEQAVYFSAGKLGQMDRMVHRRNHPLSPTEKANAQATIDAIRGIKLPVQNG